MMATKKLRRGSVVWGLLCLVLATAIIPCELMSDDRLLVLACAVLSSGSLVCSVVMDAAAEIAGALTER